MGTQTAGTSPAPPGNQHPHPPELDEKDAAEFARLMALAPDPEVERRMQQRVAALNANAPRPTREQREQSRQARVAADFGSTVLEDGSYAKTQPDGKVGHALSTPATWGEHDQPISKSVFRRHRSAVQKFAACVKRDRHARPREHRPRVARRASSSSSTSSADPPGDSDESEPAATGRPCAAPWCERSVYGSSQKRFCGTERCNQARAVERQRKHRSGDLTALERERLEDARCAGYVGRDAFAGARRLRSDGRVEFHGHALSFLWRFELAEGDDPGEFEALLNRPACRCNGHHIDGGVVGCFKCGLVREAVVSCS